MALTDNNGGGLSAADVAAVVGSNGYGNNNWGGGIGNDWWMLVLFLFAFAGNGWGNGFGGNGGGGMPYILNSTTNNDIQRGFDQQAVMSGINGINGSLNGISNQLCNSTAAITGAVNQGFSSAEIANNARQIADMQQAFASQTAITSGLTGLQSQLAQCCCDNRLASANLQSVILSENCADRAAVSDGIRDILTNQTANTQALINTTTQAVQGVMDKICQLELDAKNDKIADLQNQLTMANLAASQSNQTARILADNAAQTVALEQYLNPTPVPAYQVPNPNCCNYGYNQCGCGH